MTNPLQKGWVEFLDHIMNRESREKWFVTLSFPFNVPRPIAEKKKKEWVRRLSQALKDSGKDGKVGYTCITAQQQREVLHFHLIVFADGLDRLDKSRWEKKWEEVTAWKRFISKGFTVSYRNKPKLIRRRNINGEIQEVVKMDRIAELGYQGKTRFKSLSGGTCKILPTFPTVSKYLCNRHNFRNEGSDIVLKGISSSFPDGK
jgi:hypothetical protein